MRQIIPVIPAKAEIQLYIVFLIQKYIILNLYFKHIQFILKIYFWIPDFTGMTTLFKNLSKCIHT